MKKMKSLFLSVALGFTGFMMPVYADTGITDADFETYGLFEYDGLPYHILEDGTVEICSVPHVMGKYDSGNNIKQENVVIPAEVFHNGQVYRVTAIGDNTFNGCTGLSTVSIPEGVVRIGYQAFYNASNVQWPDMPSSLKEIAGNCFYMCRNLDKIVLPEGLTTLWQGCFTRTFDMGGHLDVIEFPGSLTELKDEWNGFPNICSDRRAGDVDKIVFRANEYWEPLKFSFSTFSRGVNCKEVEINRDLINYDEQWNKVNFSSINGLETLRFGSQVTEVPDMSGCTTLTAIYCESATPPAGAILPADAVGKITLTVPEPYIRAYKNDPVWGTLIEDTVEPSPVNGYVDITKAAYVVGEGANSGAVMITWNDGPRKGVDNLIYGVRFDSGATPRDIIDSVVSHDSRLYDIDGKGYAYDNMDTGYLDEKYDHYAVNDTDFVWNIYGDENPADGSVIYLCYEARDKDTSVVPDAPRYPFYIPEESVLGARFPEHYEMPIADDMIIPIWARTGGVDGLYAYVTWNAYPFDVCDPHENGRAYMKVDFGYVKFNNGISRYVPQPMDVMASVTLTKSSFISGSSGAEFPSVTSEKIPMKIVGPEKPIIRIKDTIVNVIGSLTGDLKDLVEYEPADATYTKFFLEVYDDNYEAHPFYRQDVFPAPWTDEATDYPGYDYWLGQFTVSGSAKPRIFNLKYFYGLEEQGDNVYVQKDGVEGLLSFDITTNPVKAVSLEGDYQYDIIVNCHDILPLRTKAMPASANQGVAMSIENATVENMANAYGVSGYMPDGQTLGKFTELVTYRPGEFDLVLTSVENSNVKRTYHVIVKDLETTDLPDDYNDGTLWLNEEWFTHKNGSFNYLTSPEIESDEEIVYRPYEKVNDNAGFGATSQYGMIFADKLFVMSKQEHDRGDIRAQVGGRLVVADATTLKTIATFTEIGGDGRACVGVGPHKAYIGHHAGVRVLTWDDDNNMTLADSDIAGIGNTTAGDNSSIGGNQALYNQQTGDMVATADKVFILQQGIGLHVIDAATDQLIRTIDDKKIGALTQSADGMLWYATATDASAGHSMLHCIDPSSMEEVKMPTEVPGVIATGWGAWRSNNFFSAKDRQMLFWNGSESSIVSSGSTIYAWDTESDASALKPIYSFEGVKGVSESLNQQVYASMRYDDRCGAVLFATTTSPSANYRYNWLNFFNVDDNSLKSVRLKDYYWFPAMPIFPDAYAPEMEEIDDVELMIDGTPSEIMINATDPDNIDANIRYSLVDQPESLDAENSPVDIALTGNKLTLTPMAVGSKSFGIAVESNGKISTHIVNVTVKNTTIVESVNVNGMRVWTSGHDIMVYGTAGVNFRLFDSLGNIVDSFRNDNGEYVRHTDVPAGVYIITGDNGFAKKVVIK